VTGKKIAKATLYGLAAIGWLSWVYVWWGSLILRWDVMCVSFPYGEQWIEGPLFHVLALVFILAALNSLRK